MKKYVIYFTIALLVSILGYICLRTLYSRDADRPEPKMWIGALQYRMNFRDLGESLNQCLGRKQFATDKIYRSNKYFSGWSCEKIKNPDKIYSFNYDPTKPQTYYCVNSEDKKKYGIKFNEDFGIVDISDLRRWQSTKFRTTMCSYFESTLRDLAEEHSFLFHCDIGRDRTGDFAAMLTYMLLEAQHMNSPEMIEALECDYEKTSALEKKQIGHISQFLNSMEEEHQSVKSFIQSECKISDALILKASQNFIL